MALEITFEIKDSDLERFRERFRDAGDGSQRDPKALTDAARKLIREALSGDLPEFIRQRIESLGELAEMVDDDAWALPPEEREQVSGALAYFVATNDVIPDDTPAFGLLDDAIAAELVLRALRHELDAYQEFSQYREAETQRRANRGRTTNVSKEDWLADQRATLHSRMRERRMKDPHGRHTMTLWGFD